MTEGDPRVDIVEQYSYRNNSADVWLLFDLIFDTDAFLNLGYSRWYQPHFIGSSQRRLAVKIGSLLESQLDTVADRPLLDVGCGRGGPTILLERRFGFEVTGVDLVPYNLARGRQHSRDADSSARFVVGDTTRLPIQSETMAAVTAIDSLVYVPERSRAVSEIVRMLASDGCVVISDLVVEPGIREADREAVRGFAQAWDMPDLGTSQEYRQMLDDSGLGLRTMEELTPHSVGRFRKWTTLFLRILASPFRGPVCRVLRWYGLDPEKIHTQVRKAHVALPHLEHVVFVARK